MISNWTRITLLSLAASLCSSLQQPAAQMLSRYWETPGGVPFLSSSFSLLPLLLQPQNLLQLVLGGNGANPCSPSISSSHRSPLPQAKSGAGHLIGARMSGKMRQQEVLWPCPCRFPCSQQTIVFLCCPKAMGHALVSSKFGAQGIK